jgi:hypothetical protein
MACTEATLLPGFIRFTSQSLISQYILRQNKKEQSNIAYVYQFKQRTSKTLLNRRILFCGKNDKIFFAADSLWTYFHFYRTATAMYSTQNYFPAHNSVHCRNVTPVYGEVERKFLCQFYPFVFHVIIPSEVGKQAGLHAS